MSKQKQPWSRGIVVHRSSLPEVIDSGQYTKLDDDEAWRENRMESAGSSLAIDVHAIVPTKQLAIIKACMFAIKSIESFNDSQD